MISDSIARTSGAPAAARRAASMPGRQRAFACAVAWLFALAWTLALGKDVHWDALNYHLYLGFSGVDDRFPVDFFAAGPPSYINPYAYVPLYLMTSAGWPALWIAVAFATLHAALLWLTFEIAMVAGWARDRGTLAGFALLAMVFAAVNPVVLQGLGSTMTDLSTGVFVLGAWLAIARMLRGNGNVALAVAAGALCGVAAALKLSNAVFAMAAVPVLALVPGGAGARVRGIAVFSIACGLAFAAVALPWSWQLWREFGNPFFPFLNHVFASPDFVSSPLRYERFIPASLAEFLLRPFHMLSASSTVHTEPRAPDLRYVALIAALVAWAVAARLRPLREAAASDDEAAARRVLAGLLVGIAVSWCIWLTISGNSRYFVPMACIVAVALALVLQRLHQRWPSTTIGVTLLVLAVQAMQFAWGTDWKRGGGPWEGPWLRVDVPARLRSEPQLFLSAGFLSGSAFLPYLHPQSGMINIAGFNVIAPNHPGGARAQRLIERNADRLRLLVPLPAGAVDRATLPGSPDLLRVYVRRLGLRVEGSDCEFLRVEGNLRGERRPSGSAWKSFIACRVVVAPEERVAYEEAVRQVDVVFDRVEDACPRLFHPRRAATQEYRYWARTYHMGSERQLFIEDGRVKHLLALRGGGPVDIGSVADWMQGPQPVDCSRGAQPAFAGPAR
jgi:hypothetical protein